MTFITPINDRTLTDVEYALINQSLTDDLKGSLNYSDLNRIENNCEYIVSKLVENGYIINITTKTNWLETDIPTYMEITRIRNNIQLLLNTYHTMSGSPTILFWNGVDYVDANTLEQNLYNLNDMIVRMEKTFRYCGMEYSGV